MTTQQQTCVTGCGRPVRDAFACISCARDLADVLRAAAGHAEDVHGVSRQTGYAGGGRAAYGEAPMPDMRRADELHRITGTVGGWERVLTEEGYTSPRPWWRPMVGPLCPPARPGHEPPGPGYRCPHRSCDAIRHRTPPSELAQSLTWLAGNAEALRKHPAAREAFRDLADAARSLEHLVDRPPTGQRLVGMCDCGQVLYAPHGRSVVKCKGRERSCGATWNVDESQDILLRHLDGTLRTAGEAARLAAYLAADRTQEQIRALIHAWHRRGLVVPHGQVWREPTDAELRDNPDVGLVAVSTYLFGELRARLASTPRRKGTAA